MTEHERIQNQVDEERYQEWSRQQPGYWKEQVKQFLFVLTVVGFLYGLFVLVMVVVL